MLTKKFTTNFEMEIYDILRNYSSRDVNIMISGGSILKVLENINYERINTENWKIFFADERLESEDTNLAAANYLLTKLRCKVTPFQSTCLYSDLFKNIVIDLAILGIGEDGHIASLFPNSYTLKSKEYFISIDDSPKLPPKRNTITVKFINDKINKLIFLLPPSNGKIKDVKQPHFSILEKIKLPFTIFLVNKDITK
ncbi:hypothetical protein H312_00143 [Anncaliia algerae PRA339]|uniref:Glucosamine/galactosamine-6-phosphate isomerase domain-containing protein n=1 Tax=Anncaliia algerae PRA339 TaxID=1288291 RepID=A0A059F5L2_9MICR|nr:hypothetical protein H312_00143 [Anncaliia algerae PRA339]